MRKIHKYDYVINGDEVIGVIDDEIIFLFDKEFYDVVTKYHWHITPNGYMHAVTRVNLETINIKLHRLVMGCNKGDGKIVDHLDGNKLNNKKSNLRFVTIGQNLLNTNKKTRNVSGVIGVSYDKERKKWRSSIGVDSKNKHIGIYTNFRDAATARLEAEIYYYGEFAPQKYLIDKYKKIQKFYEENDQP